MLPLTCTSEIGESLFLCVVLQIQAIFMSYDGCAPLMTWGLCAALVSQVLPGQSSW